MKKLANAVPGDVFWHRETGAEIEIMFKTKGNNGYLVRQLNWAGSEHGEVHIGFEWCLHIDTAGWHFVRQGYVI